MWDPVWERVKKKFELKVNLNRLFVLSRIHGWSKMLEVPCEYSPVSK